MERPDLQARIRRLGQLALGLGREISLWRKGNDPLHFPERDAYIMAIGNALAAAETARIALVKAIHRMDEEAKALRERHARRAILGPPPESPPAGRNGLPGGRSH